MTKAIVATAHKTKLIIGSPLITKELASIKTAAAKLDTRLQVVGMSILAHVAEHHNISLFNQLLDSMGKGHRKTAMVEWALANGTISKNEVDGKLDKDMPYKWDKSKTLNLLAAEDKPWFDFKPENLDDTFDFQKMLQSLLNKAAKQQSKDPSKLVNAELLDSVRALVPAK